MIVVLTGNEPYLIDYEIEKAGSDVESYTEFNDAVYNAVITYPMFSKTQVIVVRSESIPTDNQFLKMITGIPDFTHLYIVPEKIDKRTKSYKALKDMGAIREVNKVSEDYLRRLLLKLIQQNGSKIRNTDMDYLIQRSGYLVDENINLYHLNIWIKQICYASEEITREEICCFVPESTQVKIFSLSEKILKKDGEGTMKLAVRLIEEKENPVAMLSLLLRSFRLGYKCSLYPDMNDTQKAKCIGVPVYQLQSVKNISPQTMEDCMAIINDAVKLIKTGAKSTLVFYQALSDILQKMGG